VVFSELPGMVILIYIQGSLKSMDTGKYFQNGLAEIVELRRTVRSVKILSCDIFLNFLNSLILKIQR
jgi:hypothetical protein